MCALQVWVELLLQLYDDDDDDDDDDNDKIRDGLGTQGVVEVHRVTLKKEGKVIPTYTLFLAFG